MFNRADMLLLVECYDNKMVYDTFQMGHLPVDSASGCQPTKKIYANTT